MNPESSEPGRPPADLVILKKFSEHTGVTAKAVHHKRERGVWLEGREWYRGPDDRIYISIKGYEAWVKNGRR